MKQGIFTGKERYWYLRNNSMGSNGLMLAQILKQVQRKTNEIAHEYVLWYYQFRPVKISKVDPIGVVGVDAVASTGGGKALQYLVPI